jgi:hypothetical protein
MCRKNRKINESDKQKQAFAKITNVTAKTTAFIIQRYLQNYQM